MDRLVFGQRLRHFRRTAGLTLAELGAQVGRPAPFLSQVENGKREPKLSDVAALAAALGISINQLLSEEAPTRRAALEIELEQAQQTHAYRSLGLPYLKATAGLTDEALEHIIGLYRAMRRPAGPGEATGSELREANAEVAAWMSGNDGYLEHVEAAARRSLAKCDYSGGGPLTGRHISAIAGVLGYRVRLVDDLPRSTRSVTDNLNGIVYTAQRNELRTRQARKAILQTLAPIALGHRAPGSNAEVLRQRVETAYFAAAVMAPERPAVRFLNEAARARDISVEDMRERFYLSYEMAAQRFTNLATKHLDIPTHFIRSDTTGTIWKAYQNDGVPLPTDPEGGSEAQTLCRRWGARMAFASEARFDVHYQFTDTPGGSFWCATHISPDMADHAFTVGVRFEHARLFRGRRNSRQESSNCPAEECCRLAPPELESRWSGHADVSPRMQEQLLGLLAPEPIAGPDHAEVIEFLERHSRTISPSQPNRSE